MEVQSTQVNIKAISDLNIKIKQIEILTIYIIKYIYNIVYF